MKIAPMPIALFGITGSRGGLGNQALGDVLGDLPTVTGRGVADAGAAGRHDHQPLSRRDLLKTLATHLLAGFQSDVTGSAVLSAVTAARRMIDAVECCENLERRANAAANFDDLAEAAACAASAAGIRSQLFAPKDQRCFRLGDFN